MTPKDFFDYAKKHGARMVDLKFVDLMGLWRHVSVPLAAIDEGSFVEGIGYDGSSIIGFQSIEESDLILMPDPKTAVQDPILDPFAMAGRGNGSDAYQP